MGLALCTVLVASSVAGQRIPDPFYLDLLDKGKAALGAGSYRTATEDLRIASFGLLESPDLLIDSLLHLAMAQYANGTKESWRRSVERILELEDRFGTLSAWRGAERRSGSDRVVDRFLEHLAREPHSGFDSHPLVTSLRLEVLRQDLAGLPAEKRRKELERLGADSRDPAADVLLAEALFDDGQIELAEEISRGLSQRAPHWPVTTCLEGLVQSRRGCEQAAAALSQCQQSFSKPPYRAVLERCSESITRDQLARAEPLPSAETPKAQPAGTAAVAELGESPSPSHDARSSSPIPQDDPNDPAVEPGAVTPLDDEIAQAARQLLAASNEEELQAALVATRELADRRMDDGSPGTPAVADSPRPSPVRWITVTTPRGRLRSGPGTEHPQISSVAAGDRFVVTEQSRGWYQVEIEGWAHQSIVRTARDEALDTASVRGSQLLISRHRQGRIRTGPSLADSIRLEVAPQTAATASEKQADWYRVRILGWISSEIATTSSPHPPSQESTDGAADVTRLSTD